MKFKFVHIPFRKSRVILLLLISLFISMNMHDAKAESLFNIFKSHKQEEVNENIDRFDLTFDENINSPIILEKYSREIVPFQKKLAELLQKKNYKVELMRNDEIIIITIPADQLFIASDTTLTSKATKVLEPLMPIFNNDNLYHILLAFHSDNTGSATYKQNITQSRVNAIANWIASQDVDTRNIIPYPMSDFSPILENTSVANRKANRRLEIFLVPDKKMIELAKKNNLNNIVLLK